MSNDVIVGAAIALMVIGAVTYLILQRRRGRNSCGCSGCGSCGSCRPKAPNVTIDEDDGGANH